MSEREARVTQPKPDEEWRGFLIAHARDMHGCEHDFGGDVREARVTQPTTDRCGDPKCPWVPAGGHVHGTGGAVSGEVSLGFTTRTITLADLATAIAADSDFDGADEEDEAFAARLWALLPGASLREARADRPPEPPTLDTCPTCGASVRVVSSDEGTSYYEPLGASPPPPDLSEAVSDAIDALVSIEQARPSQTVRNVIERLRAALASQPPSTPREPTDV